MRPIRALSVLLLAAPVAALAQDPVRPLPPPPRAWGPGGERFFALPPGQSLLPDSVRRFVVATSGATSRFVCPMPVVRVDTTATARMPRVPVDSTRAVPMPAERRGCVNPLGPGGERR
jgi:hypothetical protein